jgi:DNA-binding response OmpR family regulator
MAILHLDDNEMIRDVVRRALGASGFSVVSADGVRAAQLAVAERDDIAGALLDVRLRDGTGVDLYWWIAAQRPALAKRVAFLSGSAGTEAFAPLAALGCPILPKPFELADLRRLAAEWEAAAADLSAPPR